eukprot:gb/GFBE01083299.1/.p1 GENE.gb/GFBE01083299.1/~~gb/GFBE01083299.1/.p1  ORF type:complete len:174 (+),score=24.26 gb/GFBE01083299.1/:1-522(+)
MLPYLGYHVSHDFQAGFDVPEAVFELRHRRPRHRAGNKPSDHGGQVVSRHRAKPRLLPRAGVSSAQHQETIDEIALRLSQMPVQHSGNDSVCLGFWKREGKAASAQDQHRGADTHVNFDMGSARDWPSLIKPKQDGQQPAVKPCPQMEASFAECLLRWAMAKPAAADMKKKLS